jgi:glucose/mannose-6-phosphate isomerase
MISKSLLKKYDPQGMHKIYDEWGKIAEESFDKYYDPVELKNVTHIVFSGMGGSGAIGDIFSSILSKTKIHIVVQKGYHLPHTVDSNTLVITNSISGNTQETLSVLKDAKNKKCKILALSSGGKMEDYCSKNNLEHRVISEIHSPRASFTNFLYGMLKILYTNLPIKKYDIKESIRQLNNLKKEIHSENLSESNPSLMLAKWIKEIPIVYYPWGLESAAIRFKNSFQENAKIHAIIEDVVEASHNGIVSWEKDSRIQPIFLQGQDDFSKTKQRWSIFKEYFNERNIEYNEITSVKGNILTKIINLIYLFDYASIYHATMNKTDPSPVESIRFIKSRL